MNKFFERVEKLFGWLGVAALIAMVFITVIDTGGRYIFNSPLPGSYEITEKYLMIFAAFFGMALTYASGGHIRLTLMTCRIKQSKMKIAVNYFSQIVSVLFNMFLLAACTKLGMDAYKEVWDATKFKLPLWPAYVVTIIGLFFVVLWMTTDLWRVGKNKSCLFKEEQESKADQAFESELF